MSLVVGVDALGLYTVRTTTTAGCTALANAVLIKDSASAGKMWLYPNPNNGRFKIRYYTNAQQLGFVRHVVLFAENGQKVFDETYPITGPYSNMNVDARRLPKGAYFVMLTDAFGKEVLATGKVILQ